MNQDQMWLKKQYKLNKNNCNSRKLSLLENKINFNQNYKGKQIC